METTNWIERIKRAIRVATDKELLVSGYKDECDNVFRFYIGENSKIVIVCFEKAILINTRRGYIRIEYTLTDRDKLELQALVLFIKEYRENMAISEFKHFISEITINDLDTD